MTQQPTNFPLKSLISIDVSNDHMSGYIQFLIASKANITAGDIMDLLNSEGIRYGVDQAAIERAVLAYKENPAENAKKRFLIVKGLPMVEGKDGRIDYFINEQPPVNIDESGKADFRNIEKYKTVEKGKLLARVFPMEPGKNGVDVYGETIKCHECRQVKANIGENVTYNEKTGEIIADVTGIYQRIRNVISVSQTLNVKGNVGLETGNLHYEGVIKISGNIERGASVSSTGDTFVEGIVESGKILCAGSLNVRGGINTKHQDCIHVKQSIIASYIENTTIECEGDLSIVGSIVGSNIISCGSIHLLKEGSKIAGGEITVLKNIFTDNLGNVNETPMTITIGVNYFFNKEFLKSLEILKDQETKLQEHILRISEIKDYIQRMQSHISDDKKIKFKAEFEEYKKLQSEHEQTKVRSEKLKHLRFYDQDPFISVKDTVHPGIVIHFFGFSEKIITPFKHCTLRFSKEEGRMMVETYREFSEQDIPR